MAILDNPMGALLAVDRVSGVIRQCALRNSSAETGFARKKKWEPVDLPEELEICEQKCWTCSCEQPDGPPTQGTCCQRRDCTLIDNCPGVLV